nr:hypothetical protein [uncultured Methanolobus sp.]
MMVKTEKRSKNDEKRKNVSKTEKQKNVPKTEKRKNVPKTIKNGKSTIFINLPSNLFLLLSGHNPGQQTNG